MDTVDGFWNPNNMGSANKANLPKILVSLLCQSDRCILIDIAVTNVGCLFVLNVIY